MSKVVVTAGAKGADIDVFACVVAYAELVNKEGGDSIPVVAGQFTSSVTPEIRGWGAHYQNEYVSQASDDFVMVDISDPDHFPDFVNHDRVREVYDHRHGHEDLWHERLGEKAHIEMVGACGTLIWEEYKKRGHADTISRTSARLLRASIVSNTLNFKSPQTTDRDRSAFKELSSRSDLPDDWVEHYFKDQEDILFSNFDSCVKADTKVFALPDTDVAIGQIELWNAERVVQEKLDDLHEIMSAYDPLPWMVNIINISKGFNFVYSESSTGREYAKNILDLSFDGGLAKTEGLLMRKHIMKRLRDLGTE